MNKLRVLDLFAGVGGFSLGLERAGGFETVAFCEIEPFLRRVLAKHWPGVPCYEDVRTLTADTLARDGIAVDVITGGFPCQDLSVAGKRAGLAGERSGLWSEIVRLIGELSPRYVIVENVANLLRGGDDYSTPVDRCVCGWAYRWRRVPIRATPQAVVYPAVRHGHVRKGIANPSNASSAIRGQLNARPQGDRDVGSVVALGDHWQEVPRDACGSVAVSRSEIGTSAAFDAHGSCSRSDHQGTGGRFEPQGAERDGAGRLVCPSCGREVADATDRHAHSTWFGRVLGDLAECGYDAEWRNIPACFVGAPHRRERVWIVAYPALMQCDGGGEHSQPALRSLPELGECGGAAHVANADRIHAQGQQPCNVDAQERQGSLTRPAGPLLASLGRVWRAEPDVGRVAYGVPAKLDGGLIEKEHSTDYSAARFPSSGQMPGLRGDREFAAPPPELCRTDARGSALPRVSCEGGSSRRLSSEEATEALQGLRSPIPTEPQQETHDLQRGLSFDAWPHERNEEMGVWGREPDVPRVAHGVTDRVARLAALGNSVVPQIPELIGRAIMEAEGMA